MVQRRFLGRVLEHVEPWNHERVTVKVRQEYPDGRTGQGAP